MNFSRFATNRKTIGTLLQPSTAQNALVAPERAKILPKNAPNRFAIIHLRILYGSRGCETDFSE